MGRVGICLSFELTHAHSFATWDSDSKLEGKGREHCYGEGPSSNKEWIQLFSWRSPGQLSGGLGNYGERRKPLLT